MALALWLALAGAPARAQTTALVGAKVLGQGQRTVVIADGRIAAVGGEIPEGATVRELHGQCLGPGIIDSHVHLALLPKAAEMAENGVVAAVDLGAPEAFLADLPTELRVWSSGPMLTAFGGYPVRSWGRDGYGREVLGPADARAATLAILDRGAKVIKVPFARGPRLTDRELAAVVEAAHGRGVKVVAHALTDASAARAGRAGCDVLAHTPTERLSDETVALWRDRAVISTLRAFGGGPEAIENLRRLREAGATVLYGTDFGNNRTAGPDPVEMALMKQAGMRTEEVRAAATSVPAAFWGMEGLGRVEAGQRAALWIGPCDCAWCD